MGKQEVEMSLFHIEEELRKSKHELGDLKMEVEEKEGRWWEEKQRAEREKLELIKVRREERGRIWIGERESRREEG